MLASTEEELPDFALSLSLQKQNIHNIEIPVLLNSYTIVPMFHSVIHEHMFYYYRSMSIEVVHISEGQKKRTHKQYVDVLLRNTSSGEAMPYAVCWIDGRTFFIDEILGTTLVPKMPFGTWVWARRYEIRLADHITTLTMEYYEDNQARGELSYTRWWVNAYDHRDCTKRGE